MLALAEEQGEKKKKKDLEGFKVKQP